MQRVGVDRNVVEGVKTGIFWDLSARLLKERERMLDENEQSEMKECRFMMRKSVSTNGRKNERKGREKEKYKQSV